MIRGCVCLMLLPQAGILAALVFAVPPLRAQQPPPSPSPTEAQGQLALLSSPPSPPRHKEKPKAPDITTREQQTVLPGSVSLDRGAERPTSASSGFFPISTLSKTSGAFLRSALAPNSESGRAVPSITSNTPCTPCRPASARWKTASRATAGAPQATASATARPSPTPPSKAS